MRRVNTFNADKKDSDKYVFLFYMRVEVVVSNLQKKNQFESYITLDETT